MIEMIFEIKPQPKERPRFSKFGAYTAPKTKAFERAISVSALSQLKLSGQTPLDGLLIINLEFYFKKPRTSKLKSPHQDIDNLCKSVMDALNGVAYPDDRKIAVLHASKAFSEQDYIRVKIKELV